MVFSNLISDEMNKVLSVSRVHDELRAKMEACIKQLQDTSIFGKYRNELDKEIQEVARSTEELLVQVLLENHKGMESVASNLLAQNESFRTTLISQMESVII
jgi:hypothetical protein